MVLSRDLTAPKQISTLNVTISDTARSYTVTCPEDSSRRYCRILDAAGRIYDGCSKSFEITWETARFRCRMLYWGDMDEAETVINVLVESKCIAFHWCFMRDNDLIMFCCVGSKRDVTWSIEENDSHVVMTCHYRSAVSPCRAVSLASQRQMMLLDGHLADRYSAYNTK